MTDKLLINILIFTDHKVQEFFLEILVIYYKFEVQFTKFKIVDLI